MKVQELLTAAVRRIEPHSETPQLDAQVLLAHVTGKNRAWVAAHPEFEMDAGRVEPLLKKLELGEPLPYVLGKWEFFGLEFDLTNDVLIPRPETELLVETAIAWLKAHPDKRTVVDIGTGSGAIAIAIAKNVPDARILATDISPDALQIAKRNAEKVQAQDQIEFVECDLLPKSEVRMQNAEYGNSAFFTPHSTFDVICSNLPYIPTETLRSLPIFGREPTLALDGGADGLDIYRRLFKLAPERLAPQGIMLLEIEATRGMQILSLAYDSFSEVSIHLHKDLAERDRLLEIALR
ncbi:MAG: peptide chain release factor N(5)-glutamine methyltransferase [Chloroflexi bacterium]|nr:peptide chain release factor N(5)-glutamine methyltransferase [Chloroflexota bacterium]